MRVQVHLPIPIRLRAGVSIGTTGTGEVLITIDNNHNVSKVGNLP
jgi:hypothetical protein